MDHRERDIAPGPEPVDVEAQAQGEAEPEAPRPSRDDVLRAVAERWPAAQRHWSRFLLLSAPIDQADQPSVAQIDLATRQVAVNASLICEKGLGHAVEGILAHEVGHHVRYPGSLAVEARLRLMERQLLPRTMLSAVNLFEDLLINKSLGEKSLGERLGRSMRDQLIAVYQAFSVSQELAEDKRWGQSPAFLFYLAIYEELWRLAPGTLMGSAAADLGTRYPGYRAEAQIVAQDLFHLGPNIYTQFLYFVSKLMHYIEPLPPGEEVVIVVIYPCSRGEPSPGDFADALTPDAREREAIRRALKEGWLDVASGERLMDGELDSRIASLPGYGSANASQIPEIMAAFYRLQAERFLLRPPKQRTLGEAIVPTTLDEWELGENVRSIDWLATLLYRGETLGSVAPLMRTPVAEYEGHDVSLWRPRMEIYLDVSGSMPDPRYSHNAMTLAAQILVIGTLRADGWVRTLLYSHNVVDYWTWCRSEIEMSRFLMHYIGGGTRYPFERLRASMDECGRDQPIRVIISDSDFDSNYDGTPEAPATFAEAARISHRLILLLHRPQPDKIKRYRHAGAAVIEVAEMGDFPRMAADLTFALFPDGSDVTG